MSAIVEPPTAPVVVVPDPPPAETERTPGTAGSPRRRSRGRRRAIAILGGIALFLLGFIVFALAVTPLIEARRQVVLAARLRTLADGGPATVVDWRPVAGDPIGVLEVPRLGIHAVVIEGTASQRTMSGPGHFAVSPLPGGAGNVVIMGRRSTFGGTFRSIDLLHKGDSIVVATGIGQFTYTVRKTEQVPAGALDVIAPTQDNLLTLVTAGDGWSPSGRTAVIASLEGDPAPLAAAPTNVTTQPETGLAGDPRAIGSLLLWGELLLAAILVIVWARSRYPARMLWLLGAPIVLALLWATYASMAQVLPSTL